MATENSPNKIINYSERKKEKKIPLALAKAKKKNSGKRRRRKKSISRYIHANPLHYTKALSSPMTRFTGTNLFFDSG
jgi:hypothetical protein